MSQYYKRSQVSRPSRVSTTRSTNKTSSNLYKLDEEVKYSSSRSSNNRHHSSRHNPSNVSSSKHSSSNNGYYTPSTSRSTRSHVSAASSSNNGRYTPQRSDSMIACVASPTSDYEDNDDDYYSSDSLFDSSDSDSSDSDSDSENNYDMMWKDFQRKMRNTNKASSSSGSSNYGGSSVMNFNGNEIVVNSSGTSVNGKKYKPGDRKFKLDGTTVEIKNGGISVS
ncbi:uncharacterized protein B0J16DRAFT_388123 [Fusarium flagelliforme]|uniref:uncharacterized protein n=1 Tax=Fusarium flagelliforme TaxID=2675880 RepID=UPI001E8E358C|nr:uncharacterized protein B0J16DRAFT_388123 [Fusarium flagelliforme]KAH7174302.1 hypothetical protein B0J16DRAFT_388123 [Fusarium flagelliforme]